MSAGVTSPRADSASTRVLHSFPLWLPRTQTWLYNEIVGLPDRITNHISCIDTWNLDRFGVPRLSSFSADRDEWLGSLKAPYHRVRDTRGVGFVARTLERGAFQAYQRRAVRRNGIQVVHSHFGTVGWQNLPSIVGTGARHVVTFYGYDVNRVPVQFARWRRRYRTLFRTVDRVLCEGPHMARCIEKLGCQPEKIRVHHLGVDLSALDFEPRNSLPRAPLRILMASSFHEKKGIPYGVAAVGMLNRDFPIALTIVGDSTEDGRCSDEKGRIQDAVREYGLQDVTTFLGYITHAELLEQARSHHVYLAPSVTASDGDTEGGAPVSVIEMLGTGMMVVATRHCDIPNVVHHGESGLLAPERDPEALARHLRWLVDHPDAWTEMARAGRRHVEREFDLRVQSERLAAMYEELVEG